MFGKVSHQKKRKKPRSFVLENRGKGWRELGRGGLKARGSSRSGVCVCLCRRRKDVVLSKMPQDDDEYPDEVEERLVNEEYKIWKKK